jgi:hypothetical protein
LNRIIYLALTKLCHNNRMLFRFRVCHNPEHSDDAQGWVVAASELQAREMLGTDAYLQIILIGHLIDLPDGAILLTFGSLH